MEKKGSSSSKQGGSSSSSSTTSSFVTTLFGPDQSSYSHSGSSSNVLGSIFGPPPTGGGREGQTGNMRHAAPGNGSKGENGKNKSHYQQEKSDLGFYSNSIYYGGQDDVSPTTRNTESQNTTYKKDGDDPNSGVDTRGNWWQGSYYY